MSAVPAPGARADGRVVTVTPCPGGPMLVRGADEIRDEHGQAHPVTRPVVAVCRCEKSQRLPWCDGTHRVLERSGPAGRRPT